ncbi:hypothetical protein BKE38_01275 [Pseudoroseomonas deserti]|uniref:Lipoprotein n=1 Tax=Teichococcus deserti TaxID=1817963 RepID=A0A1V2HA51_9PROT|nr:hypothetical protein [Pseudoroseomonas deserti]ONG58941.1 hypothetical protein BKE38_01275 [Pseudoroseomonas deserti]
MRRALRCRPAALALLLTLFGAGCDDEPSGLEVPLAQWQRSNAARRPLPTGQGVTLHVPELPGMGCLSTAPPEAMAMCQFRLEERSGRLLPPGRAELEALQVTMLFLPGFYRTHRLFSRAAPENWPPLPGDSMQAAVQGALEGTAAGRRYAVGCWRRQVNAPQGPFACALAVEGLRIGSSLVEFAAPPPAEPQQRAAEAAADPPSGQAMLIDRARVERLVTMIAAIERSFE